jgi:hypothetical protein
MTGILQSPFCIGFGLDVDNLGLMLLKEKCNEGTKEIEARNSEAREDNA